MTEDLLRPHIGRINGHPALMVDGRPFIMLAGEVHNSSSSSLAYMEQVWEKANALGMNCLLLPVTWELTEPEEGKFDFSLVRGLIEQARRYGKKISFLWFGAWKNAQCYYAPEWVKTNPARFHRAQVVKGKNFIYNVDFYNMPYSSLSYLCEETRLADARAFARLMAYIREIDSEAHTVVSVQIENETGLMGAAREHSDQADALFAASVPQDFADYMRSHQREAADVVRDALEKGRSSGTWKEVFGELAEEIFSAYHIARYVNTVAEAGKKEYAIPFTVNCWLNKPGEAPGAYPSGGPVSRMMEVWRYCAPSIDIFAPDIYVPNFAAVCEEYTKGGNPLYIPECATHGYAGARAVLCVGRYHGVCYSPFGFEDMGEPFTNQQMALFGVDVTDPALQTPQDVEVYGKLNRMLGSMMPLITEKYGTEDLQANSGEISDTAEFEMGDYRICASFQGKTGVCLVLRISENGFYLIVRDVSLAFQSTNTEKLGIDILALEEGTFADGVWQPGRRLNGDEAVLNTYSEPAALFVKLFVYG